MDRQVAGRRGPGGGARTAGSFVAGVALVVGGLGLVASGLAREGSGSPVAGARAGAVVAVNTDRPSLNHHSSPAAASFPPTLVVADRIDTPAFSCSLHRSTNGGASWRILPVPLPAGAPNCFWPDVVLTSATELTVLYTATGGRYNQPVGVWAQRYEADQPAGPAAKVAGSEAFHAHMALVGGHLVAAWVQARPANSDQPLGLLPPPNPVMVARSADGGRTWTAPVTVSEPGRLVVHPVVVPGPAGEVVVGALDLVADHDNYEARHGGQGGPPPAGSWAVVTWRSTDGGASFGPGVTVADDLGVPERVVVDLMGGPSFARDPSDGSIVAAWDGGVGDARDVYVARSPDGGITWSAPVRLSRPGEQLLPAVDVAPDGRVDVVFYDRRAGSGGGQVVEVGLASSLGDDQPFTTRVISDRSFDAGIGLASSQGLAQRGNQLALVSSEGRIVAFWGDATGGTVDDNRSDLAMVVLELDAGGRRLGTAAAGAALALGGGALSISALRARRRRPG